MTDKCFSAKEKLAGLKDFQRRTVEYVFHRLYGPNPTTRFLVADEVGLGKTLIARGIIAKALEHLQRDIDRIDVVYICSNATIAAQNINRLGIGETPCHKTATRLTYLPREIKEIRNHKVNFVSLTPGTAFDHKGRGGDIEERLILYHLLHGLRWANGPKRKKYLNGLRNMFQGRVKKPRWRKRAQAVLVEKLDRDLSQNFCKKIMKTEGLYDDLKDCCERFYYYRDKYPLELSKRRYDLIGKLRTILAKACIAALEPDLVILDEFQRFKSLLDENDQTNDAAQLASALFNHHIDDEFGKVRVLLLSATPYKMLTLNQESDEDDHYPDFIRTLEFLFGGDTGKVREVERLFSEHRKSLHGRSTGISCIPDRKTEIQNALLQVMCRTERVNWTSDGNSMLKENPIETELLASDLRHAATVDEIAQHVRGDDTLEYWKSAPYLINFLKDYDLRRRIAEQAKAPSESLLSAFETAEKRKHLLSQSQFENYDELDPANPRLRALIRETLDRGLWQLLWLPPSLPYTKPEGVFEGKTNLTKSLIFSNWNAVPNAIATLCSYEVQRRMLDDRLKTDPSLTHSNLNKKIKPLLRFSRSNERLTGMPVLAWMLPSPTLATEIDPLRIALKHGSEPIDVETLKTEVRSICDKLMKRLPAPTEGTVPDQRWYWAAPALLDRDTPGFLDWCRDEKNWGQTDLDREDDSDTPQDVQTRFKDHVVELVRVMEGKEPLGPIPNDLADVLYGLALGGPGVCSLRALLRLTKEETSPMDHSALGAAARIASGFRSLYNAPETIALLRGPDDEDAYWRLTLHYGISGNLQAVLDEQVHVLRESLGLQSHPFATQVKEIAENFHTVLSLRTSQLKIDEIKVENDRLVRKDFNARCRFALRLGDVKGDDKEEVVRQDAVQKAFNSPFRPFILASTSIGQEGLDFHTWCHSIVHWNLPSNPVDLEQREGRVHRYKGHAVRKNIAKKYSLKTLADLLGDSPLADPWDRLFKQAVDDRQPGQNDMVPYWIFEDVADAAKVERRIPLLPYSKEVMKLKRLTQGLALYRMVFGQPRQEDLLAGLERMETTCLADMADWLISLEPPDCV